MTDALPSDYDAEDGFGNNGLDKCPPCGGLLHPNGKTTGPVYDQQGRRYEHILDADPMDRPFFCEDCWSELEANRKAAKNKSLGDFA